MIKDHETKAFVKQKSKMLTNPEKFYLFGYKVPQYFFFLISGALCDVVQWFIDYGIYITYPFEWEKSTVCWTVSYTASIAVRHYSHTLLVFGQYEGTYCSSLSRTYLTYSTSIVLSMVSNHFIVAFLNLGHLYAWLITMIWTGILNYFLLKASWKKKAPTLASGALNSTNVDKAKDKNEQKHSLLSVADITMAKSPTTTKTPTAKTPTSKLSMV